MALNLTKQDSVLKAIEEFEIHGRDAFLSKYGYGKAREYFLFHEGKRYDSKAIAGVAQGYETKDDGGPLSSEDFSGGEATVQRALENLGFTVFRIRNGTQAEEIPLVLTQNEVTVDSEYDFWRDDTGVLYQYPNIYRNRVRTGRPFIYYRGVRRLGGRRGEAEYFGRGIIGDIWLTYASLRHDLPRPFMSFAVSGPMSFSALACFKTTAHWPTSWSPATLVPKPVGADRSMDSGLWPFDIGCGSVHHGPWCYTGLPGSAGLCRMSDRSALPGGGRLHQGRVCVAGGVCA